MTNLEQLKKLLPRLRRAKVARVEMNYSGSGDDGGYEPASFFDTNAVIVKVPANLAEAVTGLLESIIDDAHSGWENGDGGYGTLTFVVKTKELDTGMNYYTSDSEDVSQIFKV